MPTPIPSTADRLHEPRLRVGMVSRLTGLSAHVLRIWEKRYGAVVPQRTEAGGRLYSDADVRRLTLLKNLVDVGHSIGVIARLADEELEAMSPRSTASAPVRLETASPDSIAEVRERFLELVAKLEVQEAERLLSRAAAAVEPLAFAQELVVPILEEVGNRWARGSFRIAHEHATSAIVRGLLSSLGRIFPPTDGSRRALATTLSGERHELGVQIAALLATMYGWRVLYLGPDLPTDEIAYAASTFGADTVMISCVSLEPEIARAECAALRQSLSARTRLWIGGRLAREVAPPGAEVLDSLADLARLG